MSVYKISILLVFNRECMERNVMTLFRILFSYECFLRYFQTEWSVFLTLLCELFTSYNVLNNASLVSTWTGGEGGGQTNVDRSGQEEGVPKIPKFVGASSMNDPLLDELVLGFSYSNSTPDGSSGPVSIANQWIWNRIDYHPCITIDAVWIYKLCNLTQSYRPVN